MTTAVFLVPTPSAALLPFADGVTVIGRLHDQLRARGVSDVTVLVRPGDATTLRAADLTVRESAGCAEDLAVLAELARTSEGPLVLVNGALVAADGAVAVGLAGAGPGAAALVGPASDTGGPVRRERGRVVSAGSAYHRVTEPDGVNSGLVWVGSRQLGAAASAWSQASAWSTAATSGDPDARNGSCEALDLALVALVRAGVPVAASTAGDLPAACVRTPEDMAHTRTSLEEADEERARLRSAVKAEDDLFATYCVSSYSPRLVRLAARLGLTPTAVTWISVLFAVGAAGLFAFGGRGPAVIGAVLLYFGFVLDCVDGQLARYLRRYSRFGGWLDVLADRGKEFAVYAGLAVGAARTGDDVWPLAVAALTLQTVRHMTDGWYGAVRDEVSARAAVRDFGAPDDGRTRSREEGERIGRLIRATNTGPGRRSWLYWAKRTIVFPIGERWLLIAVCAALFDARVVFLALLAAGAVAAAYTLGVRLLRSRALRVPGLRISGVDQPGVTHHRDDGPLARALYPVGARLPIRPLAAGLVALAAAAGALFAARAPDGVGWTVAAVAVVATALAASTGGRPHAGRYDWFVPAVLRGVEFGLVIVLARAADAPLWLAFTVIAVTALFHYDLTARLDKRASPVALRSAAYGWDGRLAVLGLAAGAGVLPEALGALAVYLVVAFVAGGLIGLRRAARAPSPVTGEPTTTPTPARLPAQRATPEDAVVD